AGHAAAIALLVLAGLALVLSLVFAAPAGPARAATRIALGLTALFALSPATRFGYFCYPLALCGWVVLSGAGRLTVRRPASRLTLRPRRAAQPAVIALPRRPAEDSGS
ncbi:MAG: hypothetical protein WB688_10770, partial [Trebonia sp.]